MMTKVTNGTTRILLPGVVITYTNDNTDSKKSKNAKSEGQTIEETKSEMRVELLKTG